ncbi:forkhead box protein K2 [Phlebotomus argentipes]|uniref:forkhead box protein K2 n=1 Tax=Phlebotomus argentipes TaxID=94469 RepID=UPI002892E1DF|nr:forkhead box protein K2 [Phlebotomus argentipes]
MVGGVKHHQQELIGDSAEGTPGDLAAAQDSGPSGVFAGAPKEEPMDLKAGPYIARLSNKDNVLYIKEAVTVIGRQSSKSTVNYQIGRNIFVSRKHMQITYDAATGNFYLTCFSKNGVFVDETFQRTYFEPLKLPKTCMLRFPSTNIQMRFDSFVDGPRPLGSGAGDVAMEGGGVVKMEGGVYEPLNITIPEAGDKKMALASPPGTISATNSCPTSPGGKTFTDYPTYSINNNFQNDLFAAPSTSTYGDKKPPYSYAQLIVQSISSSPEKQLTLADIYSFISKTYPYYRTIDSKGWQNSIRHNLSLNRCFIKVPRSQDEPGKGCFWRIDPNSEMKLINKSYRKRRERGQQNYRIPFGMPRSAPASPTHMESERHRRQSPSPDGFELMSAPGSPGANNIVQEYVIPDGNGYNSGPGH